jgi:hypothetical protein
MKILGLTLREIVNILCDPVVPETAFVSRSHIDVAVCPAEFDTSTVEEEDTNNGTETVEI